MIRDRVLVAVALLATAPLWPLALALALWKRARGEGWRITGRWRWWPA